MMRKSIGSDIVAWYIHDLRQEDKPVENSFELNATTPTCHRSRGLSPRNNEVVKNELVKIIHVGIVTTSVSTWSLSVVLASNKDGARRFFVDYRKLNRLMRADKWPLPRIEEVFDAFYGGKLFTTLDLFSG